MDSFRAELVGILSAVVAPPQYEFEHEERHVPAPLETGGQDGYSKRENSAQKSSAHEHRGILRANATAHERKRQHRKTTLYDRVLSW